MLRKYIEIVSPESKVAVLKLPCRYLQVTLDDVEFMVDLVLLPKLDFDIILGIDWLSTHRICIECHAKMVTFQVLGQGNITITTQRGNIFLDFFLTHI